MEKKQTFSVHTERDVKLTVEDIDDIMGCGFGGRHQLLVLRSRGCGRTALCRLGA